MKQETKIKLFGLLMALSSIIYMGCYIADNEFPKGPGVNQEITKKVIPYEDYIKVIAKK